MQNDIVAIGLAFIEGLALILSPCILPILPLILSGSIEGGKKRPIGITVGFIFSFAAFTLFSRALVQLSGIDISIVRNISFILLTLFGLMMLSTALTEKFNLMTARFANIGSHTFQENQTGFVSGFLFGCLVGLIWTPCAGPILAAVIVQTVLQQTTLTSFFTVLAFAIGAGIPMLLIALFGRAIVANLGFLKRHAVLLRRILGVIILASVVYMVYGDRFTGTMTKPAPEDIYQNKLINGLALPYSAPPIGGIDTWINSPPLALSALKGKVILIDFWTYSCINCLRTLPYLKEWYKKYHDQGFVLIGIHSPEFDFEKKVDNVKNAVNKYDIQYPVALDNQFVTWQNFQNRYWPAHYLIDKNGSVVYTHFGEGEYAVTENNIRFLLGLNQIAITEKAETRQLITPETYLGYARSDNFMNSESTVKNQAAYYSYPQELSIDSWALQGSWTITAENIVSAATGAKLKIHFRAAKIFIVMGSTTEQPIQVNVLFNGHSLKNNAAKDVVDNQILVKNHRLYEVFTSPEATEGQLELTTTAPGVALYTFTFGT